MSSIAIAFAAVTAMTNLAGRIPGDLPVVTNVREFVDWSVGVVSGRVDEVDSATRGVQEATYYRRGDWTVEPVQSFSVVTNFLVSVDTNDVGNVLSNELNGVGYEMSAKMVPTVLDPYSTEGLGDVSYSADPGDPVTVSGDIVTSDVPGVYVITAEAASGGRRRVSVPVWVRRRDGVLSVSYVGDAVSGQKIVKEVNDAFLADLQAMTSDHVEHEYMDSHSPDDRYKKWTFGGGMRIPCRPKTRRWWSFTPVSPHVLVHANHASWIHGGTPVTLDFVSPDGTETQVRAGAEVVHLRDWAVSRGWSDTDAATCEDVAVTVTQDGTSVPDACCPYFIAPASRARYLGSFGTYPACHQSEAACLCAWSPSQEYDNGTQAVPAVICGDRDRSCFVVSSLSAPTFGGWDNLSVHVFRSSVTYGDVDYGKPGWLSGFAAPGLRADIRGFFDSRGAMTSYWKFPRLYAGDSGQPVFVRFRGKFILAGQIRLSNGNGPSFLGTAAVDILKDFCSQHGDTLKEDIE